MTKKFLKDGSQVLAVRKHSEMGKLHIKLRRPQDSRARWFVLTEEEYRARQPQWVADKEIDDDGNESKRGD